MKETKSEIPEFKSEEEMREFWDTHSVADYWDELEEAELVWDPAEDTCPRCGGQMEARSVTINLFENKLSVNELKGFHCPRCHILRVSSEALVEISRLEKKIRKYSLPGVLLQSLPIPEEEVR